MKLFVDSADIDEIKAVASYGLLAGVTTNPSLIKKAAEKHKVKNLETYIKQILRVCTGVPVSLEVIGNTHEDMLREGLLLYKKFNGVAKNVYVKVPVNPCMEETCTRDGDGIKTIAALSKKKIPVNCTLIFMPEQALLAAEAGAKLVSPFVGREDDYLRDLAHIEFDKADYFPKEGYLKGKKILEDKGIVSGVDLISKISKNFKKKKIKTEILAASIRNPKQFKEVEAAGADIATVPFSVINRLVLRHPKTLQGMQGFAKDTIPEYEKIFEK